MTLKSSKFGSTCELSEKMMKSILKSPVIENIERRAKTQALNKLGKATGGGKKVRLLDIPKL